MISAHRQNLETTSTRGFVASHSALALQVERYQWTCLKPHRYGIEWEPVRFAQLL